MKDEILKIINTTVYYSDVTEGAKAADELQRLMCYREVRAIIEWVRIDYFVPDYEEELVKQLENTYPTDMIWEAIEKVKKEQN